MLGELITQVILCDSMLAYYILNPTIFFLFPFFSFCFEKDQKFMFL